MNQGHHNEKMKKLVCPPPNVANNFFVTLPQSNSSVEEKIVNY